MHTFLFTGADKSFSDCMRKILKAHYGSSKPVGVGGAFLVQQGKIKIHVMPDFSSTPLKTDEDVNNWLKYYEAR